MPWKWPFEKATRIPQTCDPGDVFSGVSSSKEPLGEDGRQQGTDGSPGRDPVLDNGDFVVSSSFQVLVNWKNRDFGRKKRQEEHGT